MNAESRPTFPPLPRLMDALVTGFDVVAGHVWLILYPVAMDLWLWLGPHLSLRRLVSLLLAQMPPLTGNEPADVREMFTSGVAFWKEMAARFNLFAALRTLPVGIPSLIVERQPTTSPLGTPLWVDVHPALVGVVLILLTVVGWLLGAMYFGAVAFCVEDQPVSWANAAHWGLHSLALGLIWLFIGLVMAVPLSLCVSLFALISPAMATFVLLLFTGVLLWLLIPMFFSPHGIFLFRRSAWRSFLDSLHLVRLMTARVIWFILIVFVLYVGLNRLWSVPAASSWWTLVGIFGHGYVVTSLLAASFVYYQQAFAWLEVVLSQLQEQSRTGSNLTV